MGAKNVSFKVKCGAKKSIPTWLATNIRKMVRLVKMMAKLVSDISSTSAKKSDFPLPELFDVLIFMYPVLTEQVEHQVLQGLAEHQVHQVHQVLT